MLQRDQKIQVGINRCARGFFAPYRCELFGDHRLTGLVE
jgi:hypothetical protein